jgi:hypothetical protein
MPDRRLSVHDRVLAIDRLEAMARELNLIGVWLAEADCETEGDMTNDSAKALLGVCWFLSRPMNPRLPPQRWPQPGTGSPVPGQQPADQQQRA